MFGNLGLFREIFFPTLACLEDFVNVLDLEVTLRYVDGTTEVPLRWYPCAYSNGSLKAYKFQDFFLENI